MTSSTPTGCGLSTSSKTSRRSTGEPFAVSWKSPPSASTPSPTWRTGTPCSRPGRAWGTATARPLDPALADGFVGMYVNDWTVDYGAKGREAVRALLARGVEAGLVPGPLDVEFIG